MTGDDAFRFGVVHHREKRGGVVTARPRMASRNGSANCLGYQRRCHCLRVSDRRQRPSDHHPVVTREHSHDLFEMTFDQIRHGLTITPTATPAYFLGFGYAEVGKWAVRVPPKSKSRISTGGLTMPRFRSFHRHANDLEDLQTREFGVDHGGLESLGATADAAPEPAAFDDDESAA